jgi:hypothetical protein
MDEQIEKAIKLDAIKSLKEAFCRYGIEGTEDKIREIYANMEEARDYLLGVYMEIING